jgi:hypothetical protein
MAGKKLTGRVWFRAILCTFVSVGIVLSAFTFGGGWYFPSPFLFCFLRTCPHLNKNQSPDAAPFPPTVSCRPIQAHRGEARREDRSLPPERGRRRR